MKELIDATEKAEFRGFLVGLPAGAGLLPIVLIVLGLIGDC